jgi:hypothetical protein
MKNLSVVSIPALFLLAAMSLGSAQAAPASNIYGWDIQCKGFEGLLVTAAQSDDDFYVTYEGAGFPKTQVWADSTQQFNSELKTLVFKSDPSEKTKVSLIVFRNSTSGFSYGSAVMAVGSNRQDLNCYIRYGTDEDDFARVTKKPFPPIAE